MRKCGIGFQNTFHRRWARLQQAGYQRRAFQLHRKRLQLVMASPIRRTAVISIAIMLLVLVVASIFVWTRPNVPPHLTIDFLGFTNRNRPYALLAITNR